MLLHDLAERFGELAPPPASLPGTLRPHSALLLPLHPATDGQVIGVLVAALSPHRPFDDEYRSFLEMCCAMLKHKAEYLAAP